LLGRGRRARPAGPWTSWSQVDDDGAARRGRAAHQGGRPRPGPGRHRGARHLGHRPPPRPGRLLEDAEAPVRTALQQGQEEPLELPVAAPPPPTTPEDVEAVVAQARRALGGSYRLTKDTETLTLAPAEVGPLLRSPLAGDALVLEVEQEGLKALVTREAEALERPASEAGFVVAAAPPVVDGKGTCRGRRSRRRSRSRRGRRDWPSTWTRPRRA
jgi:hypothetical protein